ncbi:MAG: radical SAM protein [Syntrophales bacterium]|nr:radical SAM protein [Syntrophales bacterium]
MSGTGYSENDYVFRYPMPAEAAGGDDKCISRLDLLSAHLRSILDMLIPCSGDSEVKIDGFKLINNKNLIHRLYDEDHDDTLPFREKQDSPSPGEAARESVGKNDKSVTDKGDDAEYSFQCIKNAALYEPTIEYIQKQLKNLLDFIALESNGKVVKVDGFRLKDLSQWVEDTPCDPADMLGYIATRCNCNCVFCYNKGCPPELALVSPLRSAEEEFREIRTRLKYFSPERGRNLFTSLGTCFEAFIHPHFREALEEIRKRSKRVIRISTNGATLTEKMVAYLSGFNPLHLDIALHSSSAGRRRRLMGDRTPEIAIKSLPLLKRAGIVYDIVIVPWPDGSPEEMLGNMEETIAYADEHDVRLVQISLPGYSKYFSEKKLFDHDSLWETITERVREIRHRYEAPLVVRPALYEENLYYEQKNIPGVIGIVKGSPAFYGGLRIGDILLRIGGNIIHNRPQARDLLSLLQKSEIGFIPLLVSRNGLKLELPLDLNRLSYPSSREIDTHLGIVFMGTGLRTSYLESLRELIKRREAKNILLLSSALVKPLLEEIIRKSPLFQERDLTIEIGVPPNRFWGGNICLGDLLVVQDYIDYVRGYIKSRGTKPDLIVIPSSPFNLSGWGRDLTGRTYLDIERKTGLPVEILECQTIYD